MIIDAILECYKSYLCYIEWKSNIIIKHFVAATQTLWTKLQFQNRSYSVSLLSMQQINNSIRHLFIRFWRCVICVCFARRVVISLIQYYNKTAIQGGGRRDSAVTFADICVDINTSGKNCNTKAEDTGIFDTASNRPLHFANKFWDTVEDSTVIRQAVYC